MERTKAAFEKEGIAAHKTALQVGFIKLLAEGWNAKRTVMSVNPLLENSLDEAERMNHEILAN